jgi:hypothetical protein
MDMRDLKALEIAARHHIVCENGTWLVPSQSGAAKYRVRLQPPASRTCEYFNLRGQDCKHILAARITQERERGVKGPEIVTDEVPKRPTYPQNWSAYNLAQREEKHRLRVLLADLCAGAGLPEPPREGRGRKPVTTADKLFAVSATRSTAPSPAGDSVQTWRTPTKTVSCPATSARTRSTSSSKARTSRPTCKR